LMIRHYIKDAPTQGSLRDRFPGAEQGFSVDNRPR